MIIKLLASTHKGQSLVEVLIALAVFILGIATIGFLVLDANVSTRQGVERTQAILLAKEGLEAARSIRDWDFDNLFAGPHGIALSSNKWIFSGTSDIQNQFTRAITVTDIDVDTKKIASAVSWQFTQGRQNSVTLTDYLTDWNQTHGNAGENFILDISAAVLAAANKELQAVKIQNTDSGSIVIDKMTLWWNNSNKITRIRISNTNVYNDPSGGMSSGTEIDIDNYTLLSGSGPIESQYRFNNAMTGTDFIIKFIMTDNSTKYVLIDL